MKPLRAARNSGGAKPFSPITKSDSDSSELLKTLGASKTKKSVKAPKRFLRVDSDDEAAEADDATLQQAPSCDENLDTAEVQIAQKKLYLDNLLIETNKLEILKKALQASVLRQKQRRLVAIAGVLLIAKRSGCA